MQPDTVAITVANLVLAAVVICCVLVIAVSAVREILSRRHRRRARSKELDRDMKNMFG